MKLDDFKKLLGHKDFDELVTESLQSLRDQKSEITNMSIGGIWRTLTELAMQGASQLYQLILQIAPQGFARWAQGAWLDAKALDVGIERRQATRTTGYIIAGSNSPEDPAVIPADTIVKTLTGPDGEELRYFVTERTNKPAGVTEVAAPVRAEFPGSRYNVGASYIRKIVTHLPGIDDINNEDDWIDQRGTDEESDTSLRERYFLRWHELSRGGTDLAYVSWAKDVPGVRDVEVDSDFPRGQGTVDVIITGPEGSPGEALLAEVDAYIEQRKPNIANVLVRGPDEIAIDVVVELTLPEDEGDETAVADAATEIITGMFAGSDGLGIGDDFVAAQLIGRLMAIDNVINAQLGTDDVEIATYEIAMLGHLDISTVRKVS